MPKGMAAAVAAVDTKGGAGGGADPLTSIYPLVQQLTSPERREGALLELSKKRVCVCEVGDRRQQEVAASGGGTDGTHAFPHDAVCLAGTGGLP